MAPVRSIGRRRTARASSADPGRQPITVGTSGGPGARLRELNGLAGAAEPIVVIGTPGGGLSVEALAMATAAEVLAGGARQLALVQQPVPKNGSPLLHQRRITIGSHLGKAIEEIRDACEAGKRVVVLASGDPLLFGVGATLVRELGAQRVRIVPGVSSVQVACARLGLPWHDLTILSAHGRPLAGVVPQAMAATRAAILTDGEATPGAIAEALVAGGMEDCRAVVCERLGEASERIVDTRLHDLPSQAFDPLNVLLLLREAGAARLVFGRADAEFESLRGQITKAEVRAVTLARLRLAPEGVLWDIGAGSGALAIEAARLMPRGTVYAVERDPEQLGCIERNVARHGATNVRVVPGEAPEALRGLPAAQSVFIGGSGGRLDELLEVAPRPFVLNLAVLEHVGAVLGRFPEASVTELGVSRSARVGDGHRLAAMNPVWIVEVSA